MIRYLFENMMLILWDFFCSLQTVGEREAEARGAQEQASRLQGELTRLRQELQEKSSQEERLKQQLTEKEERTKKAIVMAKQKISQLTGKNWPWFKRDLFS